MCVPLCKTNFMKDMLLVSAQQVVPRSFFKSIVDTVRNKVLNFVLQIEKQAPDIGESESGERKLPMK